MLRHGPKRAADRAFDDATAAPKRLKRAPSPPRAAFASSAGSGVYSEAQTALARALATGAARIEAMDKALAASAARVDTLVRENAELEARSSHTVEAVAAHCRRLEHENYGLRVHLAQLAPIRDDTLRRTSGWGY